MNLNLNKNITNGYMWVETENVDYSFLNESLYNESEHYNNIGELMESINEWNEQLGTNYTSIKEFNYGEEYRNIMTIKEFNEYAKDMLVEVIILN
jgi:hypothetical protein